MPRNPSNAAGAQRRRPECATAPRERLTSGALAAILLTQNFWGKSMSEPSINLLRGSLDGMILRSLDWEPMHGLGIARWLTQVTDGVVALEDGSLYPALYRMENRGWIRSEWRITENNRRARYYRLTARGRRQLADEMANWGAFAQAVTRVFEFTPSTP